MEQAQRKVAITQCWLKQIQLTMEKQLGSQHTSSVALEKTLEKYNHHKSEAQDAHQAVLDLVEMEELEATVRSFHSFQQEIEDTAVRIQERLHLAIGQDRGTSEAQHSRVDPADSVSQDGRLHQEDSVWQDGSSFSGFNEGRTIVTMKPGSTGTATSHYTPQRQHSTRTSSSVGNRMRSRNSGRSTTSGTGEVRGLNDSVRPRRTTAEQHSSHTMPVSPEQSRVEGAPTSFYKEGIPGSTLKMEKMVLQNYDGSYVNYLPFMEKFRLFYGDNPHLSKLEKLNRLVEKCTGAAASLMQGFRLTESQYEPALEALQQRFGQKTDLRRELAKELEEIPAPTGMGDSLVKNLWSFYDRTKTLTKYIGELSPYGEAGANSLLPLILQKLPKEIRDKWAVAPDTAKRGEEIDYLYEFLGSHISGLQLSQSYSPAAPSRGAQGSRAEESRSRGAATSLTVANSPGEMELRAPKECGICGHPNHSAPKCGRLDKITKMDAKYKLVERAGLCFRCLRRGHRANQCTVTCAHCTGNHHGRLCRNKHQGGSQQGEATDGQSGRVEPRVSQSLPHQSYQPWPESYPKIPPQPPADSFKPCSEVVPEGACLAAHAALYAPTYQPFVTLQTVSIRVKTYTGGYRISKGLFDSGSSRSYLSNKLRKAVKPKRIGEEYIRYGTFGEGVSRPMVAGIYELELVDDEDKVHPISVAEVKNIAPPIWQQKVPSLDQPPFQHLKFADDYHRDGMVTIEFLLGSDVYWDLINEDDTVRQGGLVAMGTPFGYVLSGTE